METPEAINREVIRQIGNLADHAFLRQLAEKMEAELQELPERQVYSGDGHPLGVVNGDLARCIIARYRAIADRLEATNGDA